MPFFDDVDAQGIAEQHIQQLQKLEQRSSERILENYRQIRGSLQDQLSYLKSRQKGEGSTFTQQQLRGTMLQIESAIRQMSDSLVDGMYSAAYDVAGQGVDDLVEEIQTYEEYFNGAVVPINVRAAAIATETQNNLLPKYKASVDAYGDALISQMGEQLARSVISQDGLYRTTKELFRSTNNFFAGEEWKLLRIARTELHNIYGMAKITGMFEAEKTLPDLKKALIHPMDSRTAQDSKYLKYLKPIVPIGDPFIYEWPRRSGKIRSFQAPPDRPNDRGILVPYRPSWDQ